MNRVELLKTLELIKPALATNNMVPIFQCFNFTPGSVTAYDDSIAIAGPTQVEQACGIHGSTLLGLLSSSSAEEIKLDLKQDVAVLTMGKSVSKLPTSPPSDFIFEEPTDKWKFKLPITMSFVEAMKLCLETVSSDTTQAALLGVTLESDRMYSCNSDALTRVSLKSAIKGRTLMPTAFCSAVVKLWASLEMVKGTLYVSDDWLFADFDVWGVYGRVLEVKDPIDFEALIKKTIKSKAPTQPVPEGFAEAIARARVLADPESQKTSIEVEKGRVVLFTETHMGEIRDTVLFKDHPVMQANINASHLAKAIQACDQIGFHENCTVLEKAPDVLMLISNMS